jgi:hypothetical protein
MTSSVASSESKRRWALRAVLTAFVALAWGSGAAAAEIEQRAFRAPEEAVEALTDALDREDTQLAEAILGAEGEKLLHSGDPVADRRATNRFLSAYDKWHRLAYESDEKAVLHVGEEDWPWPIPIVRMNAAWQFDTTSGVEEILDRRIGRNELNAIQVCLAIVDAQREYAGVDHDGSGVRAFARRFVSTAGARDGLYWPVADGEPPSPLGPLVAHATEEGYPAPGAVKAPIPYHGYFYRILTGQGAHAQGGAYDYLLEGRMVGGFALVAYPARYDVSGIMTFLVNHDGVVYEKDLGDQTSELARGMTRFDPDQSWRRVDASIQPGS